MIDDAVRAKAHPQLVILGAGLDARAYRLPELAEVDVYEMDHPASQQDKRDRINGLLWLAGVVILIGAVALLIGYTAQQVAYAQEANDAGEP